MGLDNIPSPLPCKILEAVGLIEIHYVKYPDPANPRNTIAYVKCDATECPFRKLPHITGIIAPPCSIRGGVYNDMVWKATNNKYSLHKDLDVKDLKQILEAIKKYRPKTNNEQELKQQLIQYLETLIPIAELWPDFKLEAVW